MALYETFNEGLPESAGIQSMSSDVYSEPSNENPTDENNLAPEER